jgi:hypothetical protein
MRYSKWYWHGSGVPYDAYLRQRDVARFTSAPVVAAVERQGKAVERQGKEITSAITEQTREVVQAVEGVRSAIYDVDRTLRWGFSEVLLALGGMNDTLQSLLVAVRTPAQTAAMEQFEVARDCVRKGLFPEALEAIGAALDGNSSSPGYKLEWRFHFLKGTLHLGSFDNHSPEIVDLALAEQCFLTAAKYARADYPRDAARALTAASWACFVRAATDPTMLDRSEQHVQAALQIWSAVETADTEATLTLKQRDKLDIAGSGDAHYQLAKIAAVRSDEALVGKSLDAAFCRAYELPSRATEDGDLVTFRVVNDAVRRFQETRAELLRNEVLRRLDIAKGLGFSDASTNGAVSRLQAIADHAVGAIPQYVTPGPRASTNHAFERLWNDLIHKYTIIFKGNAHDSDFKLNRWSEAESAYDTVVRHGKFAIIQNDKHTSGTKLLAGVQVFTSRLPIRNTTLDVQVSRLPHDPPGPSSDFSITLELPDAGKACLFFSEYIESAKILTIPQKSALYQSFYGYEILYYASPEDDFKDSIASQEFLIPRKGGPAIAATPEKVKEMTAVPEKACFPPGTPILLPHATRPIETLRPGDLVSDRHGQPRRVLQVCRHEERSWILRIQLQDGTALRVTGNHTLATERGWRRAESITEGDRVLGPGGNALDVVGVGLDGVEPTYNLIVEGGTFIAGGVAVHSFTTLRHARMVLWGVLGAHAGTVEAAALRVHAALLRTIAHARALFVNRPARALLP